MLKNGQKRLPVKSAGWKLPSVNSLPGEKWLNIKHLFFYGNQFVTKAITAKTTVIVLTQHLIGKRLSEIAWK